MPATIDYAGDYSDYARATGGGIARPAAPDPRPVVGPWSGLIPGGLVLAAWCANKRICARVRRFSVLGITILLK